MQQHGSTRPTKSDAQLDRPDTQTRMMVPSAVEAKAERTRTSRGPFLRPFCRGLAEVQSVACRPLVLQRTERRGHGPATDRRVSSVSTTTPLETDRDSEGTRRATHGTVLYDKAGAARLALMGRLQLQRTNV